MPKRADQIQIGDLVDLQNDKWADPVGFYNPESPSDAAQDHGWEYEFAVVRNVERESRGCVRIDFDNFSCGFPPDHLLKMDGDEIDL